jgi:DivIVA domain-containing protein
VVERDRTQEVSGEGPESMPPPAPAEALPTEVPDTIRDVSFHTAVRGYDRHEVDRYVQRVNRAIAELEIARSPQSAVRHALDRVGEQTSGILHRARETADEITHTARSEAEETTARGRAEAREIVADARVEADRLVEEAEKEDATVARAKSQASEIVAAAKKEAEQIVTRADEQVVEHRAREEQRLEQLRSQTDEEVRSLRADTDAIEEERRHLFEEIHEMAVRLEGLAASARNSVEPESVTADANSPGNGDPQPRAARDPEPATGRDPRPILEDHPSGSS